MAIYIRPMVRQDIPAVTEIDREAFPTQWPPVDYAYEFKNQMSHYLVACDSAISLEVVPASPSGFFAWLRRIFKKNPPPPQPTTTHYIAGFVGFWIMAGESHITSVAVRRNYRRRGIGQMLMIAAIERSIALAAEFVTLEVRLSNTGAQSLYYKLGFAHVGERKKYYLDRNPDGDTREDALIMTTQDIRSAEFQDFLHRLKSIAIKR